MTLLQSGLRSTAYVYGFGMTGDGEFDFAEQWSGEVGIFFLALISVHVSNPITFNIIQWNLSWMIEMGQYVC